MREVTKCPRCGEGVDLSLSPNSVWLVSGSLGMWEGRFLAGIPEEVSVRVDAYYKCSCGAHIVVEKKVKYAMVGKEGGDKE